MAEQNMSNHFRTVTETMPEIVALTGVTHPNIPPYDDITLVMVVWNEERRLPALLDYLRPYFSQFVIGVQESTDRTLEIATEFASDRDQVIRDKHWGHGDHSFPMLVRAAKTRWCFVVSADEWPDQELMESLASATAFADLDRRTNEAIWVPFLSWIEDIEYVEQHGHLRLFKQYVGWPSTLHSRPQTSRAIWWPYGHIRHERSLDEMIQDYLRYYKIGLSNPAWVSHNTLMMHDACVSVAQKHGWDYVRSFGWWPEVANIAFRTGVPDGKEA